MNVNASVAEVMKQVRKHVLLHIAVATDQDDAARIIESNQGVDSVRFDNGKVIVKLNEGIDDYSDLATELIPAGHKLMEFREDKIDLESAFSDINQGNGEEIVRGNNSVDFIRSST